ncbi:MAG: hypothetical protein J2P32_07180, partial [Actinobacteria bacterium]|nr:hypothetical protein [Actinomycetota bacterium]
KTVLKLPTRQALVITLGGLGKHFSGPLATLEVGLGLRRESGGGRVPAECGWRFLQRDRSRWILLQMLWNRPEDEVQVVVYDDQPDTDPALLHACRLQVAAAATMAGLTWKTQEPPPRPGELSTADIAARAADVENIDQLWQRFDARDASKELKRAILLAALAPLVSAYSTQMPPVMLGFQRIVPEEAPIPETLREETESFLLDFPNI